MRNFTFGFILALIFLSSSMASAVGESAQSFTLDGRLYADAAATIPLTDTDVRITIQVLNPLQNCVLYEETQEHFDTQIGNGYFTLQVGSNVPNSKRSALDSAHPMSLVYSNTAGSISGRTFGGAACSYSPTSGDVRAIRMLVTPSTDGVVRVLSPNMILDSVPTALVAERAENLQGLSPANLLQVNTTGSEVLSQSNLENIFSSSNYSALTALLAGSSGLYSKPAANGTTPLANVSSPASPAAGQMWYDSGAIKFYNGSTTQTLGVAGSGITSLVAGTGLNVGSGPGGTITSTGTLNVDTGTTAGQIVQVAAGNKLPVIDGSNLTLLNGSAINSGTIGGSTAVNTTGNIAAGAVTASGSVTADSMTVAGNVGAATVTTTGAITATGNITGAVVTGTSVVGTTGSFGSTSTGQISLFDHASTNTNYITLKTPATASLTSDYVLTLPDALPASGGQVLTSDTSGKLTWTSPSSGSVASVGGTAPITISGTGAVPVVNVSAATTTTSGVVTLAADGGTTASTVVQATDARLSDARLPSNNSDLLKVSAMPANCAAGSSLTFSSPSGSWVCTTIPDATASSKGIMQVGTGLAVSSGTVSLTSGIATPGTYSKVTVDTYGRVTTTANIGSSDVTTALGFTPLNRAGDVMTGTFGLNPIATATETTLVTGFGTSDKGKMWFNTDLKKIHMWDGSAIVSIASPAVPTSSQNGQSLRWNDTSKSWEYFTAGVSGSGIGTFNTLTGNTQTLANGTAGTAPGWVSSGSTHTLNIPMASTSSVTAGLISKTDYDNFNGKISDSYTLAGDVTGTPAATSVDKIKGKAVTTPTASGQMLVYDGTNITPVVMSSDATMLATGAVTLKNTGTAGTYYKVTTDAQGRVSSGVTSLTSTDLTDAGDLLKATNMPATCSADKTLTFSSPTGTWDCSAIAIDAAAIASGTIVDARLPASVKYWSAATGGINFAGGNVGVGTLSPDALIHGVSAGNGVIALEGAEGAANYVEYQTRLAGNKKWSFGSLSDDRTTAYQRNAFYIFQYSDQNNAAVSSYRLFINDAGKVGIGNTNPTQTLDVTGNIKGTQLCIGSDCRSAWPGSGGGGTVTSVGSGTGLTGGPITGSGTLNVDVGTTAGKILQVAAGDKLPAIDGSALTNLNASNLASGTVAAARMPALTGDVTTSAGAVATTLAGIQGKSLTVTTPSTGHVLKYDGTGWINSTLSIASLTDASDLLKASNMPANCSASQTLTFSSPSGTWVCSTISLDASAIASGTIDNARLPSSAKYWQAATGGINYAGGNVGIGTATPGSPLDIVGNTNAGFYANVQNTSTGTAAYSGFNAKNDSGAGVTLFVGGSGATTTNAGLSAANLAILQSSSAATGGLLLNASINAPLVLGTSNTERIRITGAGNVGIGTTTPGQKLETSGNIKASGSVYATSYCDTSGGNCKAPTSLLTSESDTLATVTGRGATTSTLSTFSGGLNTSTFYVNDGTSKTWIGPSGGVNYIESGNSAFTANAPLYITGYNANVGSLLYTTFATTALMGGKVGIGITSPSKKLHVVDSINSDYTMQISNGGGSGHGLYINAGSLGNTGSYPFVVADYNGTSLFYVRADGGYYHAGAALSTKESKKEIRVFDEDAIALLKNIQVVSYRYKMDSEDHVARVGFLANDENHVYDERLTNKQRGFATETIVGVMIKALQQVTEKINGIIGTLTGHDQQIARLKNQVEKVESENREMRARLDRLESLLKNSSARQPASAGTK